MFRRLRSKIILSFCLLMVAGGAVSTIVVRRNLSQTLASMVDRNGNDLARTLAAQLGEPLAYRDRLAVRRLLTGAREANSDVLYAFVVSPAGWVTDHSFPVDQFPEDLLQVAPRSTAVTLRAERGSIRDIPVPVADGVLGALHVGVSTSWVDAATLDAVRNVLLMTAFAMVVGVAGILILAGLITRPVLELRVAAIRLGEGDPSAVARVHGHDEIADLARTFNAMAGQIRDRIAESEDLRAYVERVLDHMESEILVVSGSGAVEYANRIVQEGRSPLVGRSCSDVLRDERPCDECPVAEVIETGHVVRKQYRAPSGSSYELTYVPMVGRDGIRSVVERAFDVTERLELRERIHKAQRLAVAGEIAAGVVHSVNNPLDGVRRALDLAATRPDDPERVQRMLALAAEGTDRIANVTRTLLGFARSEVHPEAVLVRPDTLVEAAVELAKLKAQDRGITIEVDAQPALPETLIDPQGMEEVLVNLLLNAVDACEPGGRIEVRTYLADDGMVEISVQDDGPGIPEHLIERIFEPFFTTKVMGEGTGLGLSVARRIVEAHQGEIVLARSPEGGASFRVRIPPRPELTTAAREA
jgi:signal transduction histidine kinase/HAMP domain-containing protein